MESREKVQQLRACQKLTEIGYQWTPPDNANVRDIEGTLQPTDANQWDRKRGFYTPDIFTYIRVTQPEVYLKLFPKGQTEAEALTIQEDFLTQLARHMDRPFKNGGGLVRALANYFSYTYKSVTVTVSLGQLPPDSSASANRMEAYKQNILRVIHEVRYSEYKEDRIDLVFTVNGLPFATLELKNGFSQTYKHAIVQYMKSRLPEAVNAAGKRQGKKLEPLLAGKRAVVHLAVDPDEVYMTSLLAGDDTKFFPFNPEPDSAPRLRGTSRSDFLWEDVLAPSSILAILKSFVVQQTVEARDVTGKPVFHEQTIFPRYHQWFGVSLALGVTVREGVGGSSLMMWSAGSGKSHGISWLAHCLETLHWDSPSYTLDALSPRLRAAVLEVVPSVNKQTQGTGKLFTGGGFVITDRTNLDSQLGATVSEKESVRGKVVRIGDPALAHGRSKTKQLVEEIDRVGSGIKIVTIQTFPHVIQALANSSPKTDTPFKLQRAPQTFFVIRDEAHSSEGGTNTAALRETLNLGNNAIKITAIERRALRKQFVEGMGDDEALTDLNRIIDQQLRLTQQSRASGTNLSYFAFTATPRAKTLEFFGREIGADGQAKPLHSYSMQQAIDEKYILDVLANYTAYEAVNELVADTEAGQRVVEAHETRRALQEWVRQQATTVEEKSRVILEHFHDIVQPALPRGLAQGMVFTASRDLALAYKRTLDSMAKTLGFEVYTLVAFSGEVEDPISGEILTEQAANDLPAGKDIARVFTNGNPATGKRYHLLIVADKYTTGYDNQYLVAGYVDKGLRDINAVQTLARLNRAAPQLGKTRVYVVDFINDPADIQAAYAHYYGSLSLAERSNPNTLHELQTQIAAYNLYDQDQLENWVRAWGVDEVVERQGILSDIRGHYKARLDDSVRNDAQLEEQYYRAYPGLLKKYYDVYIYQSTLRDYGQTRFEQLALFYGDLFHVLTHVSENTVEVPSLEGISLGSVLLRQKATAIVVGPDEGSIGANEGATAEHGIQTPEYVQMRQLIDDLNTIFSANQNISERDLTTLVDHLIGRISTQRKLMVMARGNDREKFTGSDHTQQEFLGALADAHGSYQAIVNEIAEDQGVREMVARKVLGIVWQREHKNSQIKS